MDSKLPVIEIAVEHKLSFGQCTPGTKQSWKKFPNSKMTYNRTFHLGYTHLGKFQFHGWRIEWLKRDFWQSLAAIFTNKRGIGNVPSLENSRLGPIMTKTFHQPVPFLPSMTWLVCNLATRNICPPWWRRLSWWWTRWESGSRRLTSTTNLKTN